MESGDRIEQYYVDHGVHSKHNIGKKLGEISIKRRPKWTKQLNTYTSFKLGSRLSRDVLQK